MHLNSNFDQVVISVQLFIAVWINVTHNVVILYVLIASVYIKLTSSVTLTNNRKALKIFFLLFLVPMSCREPVGCMFVDLNK